MPVHRRGAADHLARVRVAVKVGARRGAPCAEAAEAAEAADQHARPERHRILVRVEDEHPDRPVDHGDSIEPARRRRRHQPNRAGSCESQQRHEQFVVPMKPACAAGRIDRSVIVKRSGGPCFHPPRSVAYVWSQIAHTNCSSRRHAPCFAYPWTSTMCTAAEPARSAIHPGRRCSPFGREHRPGRANSESTAASLLREADSAVYSVQVAGETVSTAAAPPTTGCPPERAGAPAAPRSKPN